MIIYILHIILLIIFIKYIYNQKSTLIFYIIVIRDFPNWTVSLKLFYKIKIYITYENKIAAYENVIYWWL